MGEKTHWLQSPNKNYLGHWDLPESGEMIVTIESAQWEEVENPVLKSNDPKKFEACRVIRFKEDIKPLICNQTNAQSIVKSTGVKFMEDSKGSKIILYIDTIRDRKTKEDIDCIRIRNKKVVLKKPKLTPKSDKWEAAKKAVKDGSATFESISSHYDITKKDFDLLCG